MQQKTPRKGGKRIQSVLELTSFFSRYNRSRLSNATRVVFASVASNQSNFRHTWNISKRRVALNRGSISRT